MSGQGAVVAAMDLPRERSEIEAWARDFGQTRGLGEYRASCRAVHGPERTGWGLFMIGMGLLPGLTFVLAAPAQLRPAMAGISAVSCPGSASGRGCSITITPSLCGSASRP